MSLRAVAWALLAGVALVAGLGAVVVPPAEREIPLRSEGSAYQWVLRDGELLGRAIALKAGVVPDLLPGSRVLDPGLDAEPAVREAALEGAARQRAWLAETRVPEPAVGADQAVDPALTDLAEDALLDLYVATHTATGEVRAPFAAPTGAWRYVWPRDTAFVAVALARTGHVDDAVAILGFFEEAVADGGQLQARYREDGTAPDDRGTQLDGAGWLVWAAADVVEHAEPGERAAVLASLAPLVDGAAEVLEEATAGESRLPAPSMDYWELPERRLTLGTAAPVLAGLEALAELRTAQDDPRGAEAAATRAAEVRDAVVHAFAPTWPRYAGGTWRDAATAFALPPFTAEPLPGALQAWRLSATGMARPAGGLAPGERWTSDGYSWTPQTALYALTAAAVDDEATALHWLRWLAGHRTLAGSIPEKVSPQGEPAQVAPLVWSSSLVLLALDELEG